MKEDSDKENMQVESSNSVLSQVHQIQDSKDVPMKVIDPKNRSVVLGQ